VFEWLKNQGESVKLDEPVVELETDKVNVEVPSPAEGILSIINFKNGDTVEVGALLGSIGAISEKIIPIKKARKQTGKKAEHPRIEAEHHFLDAEHHIIEAEHHIIEAEHPIREAEHPRIEAAHHIT
jgi:2-oxoglutarate dehydrogenase E2 component (dihydrolipoamide succinyltransferase)